jgi:hypothetical protein
MLTAVLALVLAGEVVATHAKYALLGYAMRCDAMRCDAMRCDAVM